MRWTGDRCIVDGNGGSHDSNPVSRSSDRGRYDVARIMGSAGRICVAQKPQTQLLVNLHRWIHLDHLGPSAHLADQPS
jgi:hypothetical protein